MNITHDEMSKRHRGGKLSRGGDPAYCRQTSFDVVLAEGASIVSARSTPCPMSRYLRSHNIRIRTTVVQVRAKPSGFTKFRKDGTQRGG